MRRALVAAALWAAAACTDSPYPVEPGTAALSGGAGSGSFIVTLHPSANAAGVARAHGVTPTHVYTHALNGFAAQIPEQALQGLERNPHVRSIEPDGSVTTQTLWGLDRIDQRSLPLSGSYTFPGNGAGVTIYIVDTGIRYDHADFGGRASLGFDALGGNGSDCQGHGTHVAGTAAGQTHGIAKAATIKSVRVLDCSGFGMWSSVIAGLDWIATQSGACVVNASIGGDKTQAVNDAVARLAQKCAVVVAAGNDSKDSRFTSPASAPEATTVCATDATDTRAWWSNFGGCDLFAPGVNVTSAYHTSATATATMGGTSMASPHVAGVAALILAEGFPASKVDSVLTWRSTKGVVQDAKSVRADLLFSGRTDGGAPNPIAPPPPAPNAPSELTSWVDRWVHADTALVRFSWKDNSHDENNFLLHCTGQSPAWYLTFMQVPANTTAGSFRLAKGGWMCQVFARNDGGVSPSSNEVWFTLGSSEPPPPEEPPPSEPPPCKPRGKSGKCR